MSLLETNPSEFIRSGLGADFSHLTEPEGWRISQAEISGVPPDAIRLEKRLPDTESTLLLARYEKGGQRLYHVERRHPPQTEVASSGISFMRTDFRGDPRLGSLFSNAHQEAIIAQNGD